MMSGTVSDMIYGYLRPSNKLEWQIKHYLIFEMVMLMPVCGFGKTHEMMENSFSVTLDVFDGLMEAEVYQRERLNNADRVP